MPQPIDMQTEIARVTMADRIQDATSRAALAAQQRAVTEEEGRQVQAETTVEETPENQSKHIDKDGRRKAPFARKRSKSKKKDKGHPTEGVSELYTASHQKEIPETGGHDLDVSI